MNTKVERKTSPTALIEEKYILKTITPLAMHGANNSRVAEFRAPSLKGVLRYFWRTLQDEANPKQLLEQEEKFFGGTTTEKGKSPISILIPNVTQGNERINILPHKNANLNTPAIATNKELNVTIRANKTRIDDLNKYKQYMNYLFHVAGFGQRSRRGFGSCQWNEHKWESVNDFSCSLKQVLQSLDMSGKFMIHTDSQCILERKEGVRAPHPVLNSIWIGEGKQSYQQVLTSIGYASHYGNRKGTLGAVEPRRKASPLWVTVRKMNEKYYPIITEVKTTIQEKPLYENERRRFLQELGVMI
ncbi:type III-B CRISPR module RAMP protein Cmr1 [Bacillus sp. FJAT-47783]|uniref:type III-B CRISPR module RAMP protein Cmr1 n=1 Tax=Bacillus sp. FJAT-47783 TaxID=2922712 RepID=UPI001FAE3C95|nr:type III-B CRISPR module RAMP protein Cmr1 [Bacillus sp. FJAT-47783]